MRSPIGGHWPDLPGVIASLSIRHALKVRRIPVALDSNLRGRAIQFLKIVCCQFDESRADILLQSLQFCSAWDGDDPRLLGKEPGESDLSGGCMFARRERLNNIYQTDSPLDVDCHEVVAPIELCVLRNCSGEIALSQRAVRNETDAQFLQRRDNLFLGALPP